MHKQVTATVQQHQSSHFVLALGMPTVTEWAIIGHSLLCRLQSFCQLSWVCSWGLHTMTCGISKWLLKDEVSQSVSVTINWVKTNNQTGQEIPEHMIPIPVCDRPDSNCVWHFITGTVPSGPGLPVNRSIDVVYQYNKSKWHKTHIRLCEAEYRVNHG